ncbi:MAG: tRNA (adenosine(37)-N6)-dimethylallyltransferase MiaA [Deltaproteobacteria bacterium]|nr:tRNA (adenosine(37)-N6)-dimethylallyltransferase MiaA [Deltaproteobacteria bacterium]
MVSKKGIVTIICGPTAVGKTAYAIDLALKENAEIISADSGQIYRGLDIGTAKPTDEERRGVPFHLIDILDPSERFSAADFRKQALQTITEIQQRGKKVFIVGGTGLYLKVLEEGIFEGPSADPEIRARLEGEIREQGIEHLYRRLQKIDPTAAKKMDGYNRQRIIRALEVYELTGRSISSFWKIPPSVPLFDKEGEGGDFVKLGLTLPRDELNRRIETRIDEMIQKGWIEETEVLLKKWGAEAPGLKLIGYRELAIYLAGKTKRELAIELIKTATRHYAKRQLTWFKKDKEIRWVNPLTA